MSQSENPIPSSIDLDLVRQRAAESLYFFAKGILRFNWLVPHIHGPVCDLLSDKSKNRKRFILPRGWLKTTVCTISYPLWRAIHDPNLRILLAQNNLDNARKKLRVIRDLVMRNDLLRALYPEVLPTSRSVWSADSLCLTRSESHPESTFECIGVRGQPTSRHYDIIIEDDTVAPDFDELGQETLAPTHDDVRKAITWHSLALPLLTDPSKGEIIVVGTRWYENDLMSHISDKEPHYSTIERSCREDEEGKSDPKGKITYPERFNDEVLDQYECSLGPYFFSTLMLNNPVNIGNMVFKPTWFQEYEELPHRNVLDVYTTLDCATDPELSSSPKDLDYSTVMTCAKDRLTGFIYVLDYFRERCSPGDHAAALFEHVLRWRPIVVGYENVAYQRSIEYWLKELMHQRQQYFLLQPIKRTGRKSKEVHILGLQPIAASGVIHLRPFMRELMTEFLSFPRGKTDDLIDTMAMQTQLWRRTVSKNERHDPARDEFTVSAAIENIRARQNINNRSVIFDPIRCASTLQLN